MRPQYNRRAMRATAALFAAALAAGVYGAVASASTGHQGAQRTVAPVARPASAPTPAGGTDRPLVAAPLAHSASASGGRSRPLVMAPMARLGGASGAPDGARRQAVAAPTGPGAHSTTRWRSHRHRATPRLAARMLHRDLLVGHDVAFIGALRPAAGHKRVEVQARAGRHWIDVATARTTVHGHFIARYWPHTLGAVRMRLRVGVRHGRAATVEEPAAMVFHEALVSWYGPGGETACGEELAARTLGVANLTLPCGTRVTLRYGGRSITVPVIDRGPYVAGREFDLTYATKQALGAGDLTVVWASS